MTCAKWQALHDVPDGDKVWNMTGDSSETDDTLSANASAALQELAAAVVYTCYRNSQCLCCLLGLQLIES